MQVKAQISMSRCPNESIFCYGEPFLSLPTSFHINRVLSCSIHRAIPTLGCHVVEGSLLWHCLLFNFFPNFSLMSSAPAITLAAASSLIDWKFLKVTAAPWGLTRAGPASRAGCSGIHSAFTVCHS